MRYIVLAATLALAPPALATPALAQAPSIQVQNAWARATAPQATSGLVYLMVTDTGAPDRLIAAASPVAGVVQLHRTVNDNGIMRMPEIPSLSIAPGQPVVLAPGGYHIMLMRLKRPLNPGDHFPVTLTFAKAGKITTTVTVGSAGASTAPMQSAPMDGMHMGGMPMAR